jgi:hypothetical protein
LLLLLLLLLLLRLLHRWRRRLGFAHLRVLLRGSDVLPFKPRLVRGRGSSVLRLFVLQRRIRDGRRVLLRRRLLLLLRRRLLVVLLLLRLFLLRDAPQAGTSTNLLGRARTLRLLRLLRKSPATPLLVARELVLLHRLPLLLVL